MTAYTGISKHARWREVGDSVHSESWSSETKVVWIKECQTCQYKTIRTEMTWHCGETMRYRRMRPHERIVLMPWPMPGR